MAESGNGKRKVSGEGIEEWALSFLCAFLLIALFSLYRQMRGIPFVEVSKAITAEYPKFLLVFCAAGIAAWLIFCRWLRKPEFLAHSLFFGGNLSFTLIAWFSQGSLAICIALFFLAAALCYWYFQWQSACALRLSEDQGLRAVLVLILVYSFAAASVGIVRHRIFLSSGNDLGTFDQMFYAMGKTLRPLNTITGAQINQFTAVHFSPILYLLLPAYLIFPSPETLIFIQSFFVGLAALPLFKLSLLILKRKDGSQPKAHAGIALLVVVSFLLQPGILGGQFKDFHENALLPFFLLSFIYFFETGKTKPALLFLMLTLMVKEDAVIYTCCFALCMLFRKAVPRKRSLCVIGLSGLYFLFISAFILDTGTFAYRYGNLITDQSAGSFFDILKILLTNPLYLFTQIFTPEKMVFLGWLFFPLGLIPLSGLFHLSEIPLFLPLVLLNLLPEFYGQYSIDFQYHFGTIALFIWLCTQKMADMQDSLRKTCTALLVISAVIFSASYHQPKITYFKTRSAQRAEYQIMSNALAQIPAEAVVSATNHFYPHLSHRYEVYPIGFPADPAYIAIDLRSEDNGLDSAAIKKLIQAEKGYGIHAFVPDWFLILERDEPGALDPAVRDYLDSR